MKNLIFAFIIYFSFSHTSGQNINKYKIISIDSFIVSDYFVIKIQANDGKLKTLLSHKIHRNENVIKTGSKYSFELQVMDIESLLAATPILRNPHAFYVNGIKLLDAGEPAYYTSCLTGLSYLKHQCGKHKSAK